MMMVLSGGDDNSVGVMVMMVVLSNGDDGGGKISIANSCQYVQVNTGSWGWKLTPFRGHEFSTFTTFA